MLLFWIFLFERKKCDLIINRSFSDPFVTYNDSQYNPANADADQSRQAQHVQGDHPQ